MSIPPLRLLLPQATRYNDLLPPSLLVQSASPAACLVIPFLLLAQERDRAIRQEKLAGGPDLTEVPVAEEQTTHAASTLILNCYGSLDALVAAMDGEPVQPLSRFLKSDLMDSGRFLETTQQVEVIHIDTLASLLGILFVLSTQKRSRATTGDATETELHVADSQESSESLIVAARENKERLLVLLGIDVMLSKAGEWTGQGLARVAAAAIDACADDCHLLLHCTTVQSADNGERIPLLTASPVLPATLQIPYVTVLDALRPLIQHSWVIRHQTSEELEGVQAEAYQGFWQDDTGTRYQVTWRERQPGGLCFDVHYARL
ncbi:hypothetical protein BCR37DRAFT_391480 [Protomyces lactucae-debilis]|uniref:Uncharacterized protein n=1 Tax=Protomyces lactucae-debilis TaxID=2754530 RepID=A0A1Y2FNY9_PROLT|nr:uncharacterized protein BCR37DRAFT_391480 [Protomyces lactucae-debilis]ORY85720.1 hypothetical protein BCR37DRAFT_391480 [Protomyces lactucae-debilis]